MKIKNLNLPVDLQLKLFDQTILPIITYSCAVFGFENCANLKLIHTKFLHSIIQARKSTPLCMIYGELGRYPIGKTIKTKMINNWSRLTNGKHNKSAFILYQKMKASEETQFKWLSKIKQILDESGRSDLWLNQPSNFNCSRTIKSVLEAHFLQTWSTKLDASSKGLNYRLFKDSINLEPYFVKLPRTLFMHLGKLRTDNHRFPCERGRWQELELSERKCLLCSRQEICDGFHYLVVCPLLNSERKRFIERHYYSNPNILKFKALMNCTDERHLKDLCKFDKILIKNVQ